MFEDIELDVQNEYNVIVGNDAHVALDYAAVDGLKFLLEKASEDSDIIEENNQIQYILINEFNDLEHQLNNTDLPSIENEVAREELGEILRELIELREVAVEQAPQIYMNQATVAGIRLLLHTAAQSAEETIKVSHIDEACNELFLTPLLFVW